MDKQSDNFDDLNSLPTYSAADYEHFRRIDPNNDSNFVMDTARDLGRLGIGLVDTAVGLGDLVYTNITGESGRGALKEHLGYDPNKWIADLNAQDSFARQDSRAAYDRAEGFVDSAAALISNPRELFGQIVQNLPNIYGMTAAAKGAAKYGLKKGMEKGLEGKALQDYARGYALAASSAAEGALTTGSVASAIADEKISKGEVADRADMNMSLAAGAGTALIGRGMAKFGGGVEAALGQRLANGAIGETFENIAGRNMFTRTGKAFLAEGGEEALQSGQEEIFTNIGADNQWNEGIGKAMGSGFVLGGAMGGGMHALHGTMDNVQRALSKKATDQQSILPDANQTAEAQAAEKAGMQSAIADSEEARARQALQGSFQDFRNTPPQFSMDQAQAINAGTQGVPMPVRTYEQPPEEGVAQEPVGAEQQESIEDLAYGVLNDDAYNKLVNKKGLKEAFDSLSPAGKRYVAMSAAAMKEAAVHDGGVIEAAITAAKRINTEEDLIARIKDMQPGGKFKADYVTALQAQAGLSAETAIATEPNAVQETPSADGEDNIPSPAEDREATVNAIISGNVAPSDVDGDANVIEGEVVDPDAPNQLGYTNEETEQLEELYNTDDDVPPDVWDEDEDATPAPTNAKDDGFNARSSLPVKATSGGAIAEKPTAAVRKDKAAKEHFVRQKDKTGKELSFPRYTKVSKKHKERLTKVGKDTTLANNSLKMDERDRLTASEVKRIVKRIVEHDTYGSSYSGVDDMVGALMNNLSLESLGAVYDALNDTAKKVSNNNDRVVHHAMENVRRGMKGLALVEANDATKAAFLHRPFTSWGVATSSVKPTEGRLLQLGRMKGRATDLSVDDLRKIAQQKAPEIGDAFRRAAATAEALRDGRAKLMVSANNDGNYNQVDEEGAKLPLLRIVPVVNGNAKLNGYQIVRDSEGIATAQAIQAQIFTQLFVKEYFNRAARQKNVEKRSAANDYIAKLAASRGIKLHEEDIDYASLLREDNTPADFDDSGVAPSLALATNTGSVPAEISDVVSNGGSVRPKPGEGRKSDEKHTKLELAYAKLNSATSSRRLSIDEAVEAAEKAVVQIVNERLNNELYSGTTMEPKGRFALAFRGIKSMTRSSFRTGFFTMASPQEMADAGVAPEDRVIIGSSDVVTRRFKEFYNTMRAVGEHLARSTRPLNEKKEIVDKLINKLQDRYLYPYERDLDGNIKKVPTAIGELTNNKHAKAYDAMVDTVDNRLKNYITSGIYMAYGKGVHAPMLWSETYTDMGSSSMRSKDGIANSTSINGEQARAAFSAYVQEKLNEKFPNTAVEDLSLEQRIKFYEDITSEVDGVELFYDAVRRDFNGKEIQGSYLFKDAGSDAYDYAEVISDFRASDLWMDRWIDASGIFWAPEMASEGSEVHKRAIDAAYMYNMRVGTGLSASVDMKQLLRIKAYLESENRALTPAERDALRELVHAREALDALVADHSTKTGLISYLSTASEAIPELSVALHDLDVNRKLKQFLTERGKDTASVDAAIERAQSRYEHLATELKTARNAAVDKKLSQEAREKYFDEYADNLKKYVLAFHACDAFAASNDARIVLEGDIEKEAEVRNQEIEKAHNEAEGKAVSKVIGYAFLASNERIKKLKNDTENAALTPAQRAMGAADRVFKKFIQDRVAFSQDTKASMSDVGAPNMSRVSSLVSAQYAIASSIEDLAANVKTKLHAETALASFARNLNNDADPAHPVYETRKQYNRDSKAANVYLDETLGEDTRRRLRKEYRPPVLTAKKKDDSGRTEATKAAKQLMLSPGEQADILTLLDGVLKALTDKSYATAPAHKQERYRKALYRNVLSISAPAYEGFSAKGARKPATAKENNIPLSKRYKQQPGFTHTQLANRDKQYHKTINEAIAHLVAAGVPEARARELVNNTRFGTLAPEDDRYGYTVVNNDGKVLILLKNMKDLSVGERLFYLAHELCHQLFGDLGSMAAESAANNPALKFEVVDGRVVPVGEVAKEIFQLMDKFNVIKEALNDYPIGYVNADPRTHKNLANEFLAQLGAIWLHDPAVARVLNKEAPGLGKIFQQYIGKGEFLNDAKATNENGLQQDSNAGGNERVSGDGQGESGEVRPQDRRGSDRKEPLETDRDGGPDGSRRSELQHSEAEGSVDDESVRRDQEQEVTDDEEEEFNAYSFGEAGSYAGAVRANKEAVARYDRKLEADPNNVNAPAWKRLREKALERLQAAEKGLKDAQARQENRRAAQREKLHEDMRSAKNRDEDDDDDDTPPPGGGGPRDNGGFAAASQVATKQAADKVFVAKEATKSAIKNAVEKLPTNWQNLAYKVADIANGFVGDWLKQAVLGFSFTESLANKVKEVMPSVGRWMANRKARESWQNAQQELLSRFKDRAAALPKAVYNQVNEYLEASTLSKAWGYRPAWLPDAAVDSKMAEQFNALPAEAQQFVKDTFEQNHKMLQQKFAEMSKHTDELFQEAVDGAEEKIKKSLREQWEEAKRKIEQFRPNDAWPYMPLLRRGSHAVVARSPELIAAMKRRDELFAKQRKDMDTFTPEEASELAELVKRVESLMSEPDHYIVEFVDGQGTANQRKRAIEKEHPGMVAHPFPRRESMSHKGLSYFNVGVLEDALFNRLDKSMPETDQRKYISHMLATLNDIYIDSLAETHARKSQKHRLNVAGYNKDMVVNFLDQGNREIQYLANVMYSKESRQAMQAMWKEAQAAETSSKAEDYRRIAREIESRELLDFEYKPSEFVDKLQRTNSVMMLLTSPAYYLQNATQPFLMSAPYMCGRFKASQVYDHLTKDFMALGKVFAASKGKAPNLRDPSVMSKECYEALQRSRAAGNIDIGMAQDFGDLGHDTSALWRATDKLSMVARKMEMLNRVATFKTAFELAYAETKDAEAAWKYADEVLYETHGNYSSSNEPRFFKRGGLGGFGFKGAEKLIFQFRKYQLIQLGLMCRLAKDSIMGDAVARKAFAHVIGVHMAMTGLKGTPFAMMVLSFMSLFGGEGDDDEDVIRDLIGNKDVSDLLLGGLPTLLGLDLSERIGASSMMSPFPFLSADPLDGKDEANETLVALGGPAAAQAVRMLTGIGLMRDGEYWKGAEKLLPNGLANAMRGYRYATEGYTNSSGVVTIPDSEISAMESFFQAIGFTPKTMTDKFRLEAKLMRTEDEFKRAEKQLNMDFRDAASDPAERARIRQEYVALQNRRAELGFKPKPVTQLLKNEKKAIKDSENARGGVITNNTNRAWVEYWSNR